MKVYDYGSPMLILTAVYFFELFMLTLLGVDKVYKTPLKAAASQVVQIPAGSHIFRRINRGSVDRKSAPGKLVKTSPSEWKYVIRGWGIELTEVPSILMV